MKYINAEKVIHAQIYDDGYEEWSEVEMTVEEYLDAYTDEGCPTVVTQPEPNWIPCSNCARNADNGGLYPDGRTRCPIQEHYALLKDGYCHLAEPWEGEQP